MNIPAQSPPITLEYSLIPRCAARYLLPVYNATSIIALFAFDQRYALCQANFQGVRLSALILFFLKSLDAGLICESLSVPSHHKTSASRKGER